MPPSVPLGTSMCCGQPQPQKLKEARLCVRGSSPCAERSRNVCSKGIVTDDCVDIRVMVFCPAFTVEVSNFFLI